MSRSATPARPASRMISACHCVDADTALAGADVVVLAVPDTAIGKVAAGIVDKLEAGTMVIVLDAAAPSAGHLPKRDDLTYFVTHPCHPPIFNDETDWPPSATSSVASRPSSISFPP